MAAQASRQPASILFLCGRNAVRSPIAETLAREALGPHIYVASAGVMPGRRDPFVDAVLAEKGLALSQSRPKSLAELEDLNFDLAITLSPEAHHQALELTRTLAIDVQYWPTPDPTQATGSREQILTAYRELRDRLARNIAQRLVQPRKG